jgi:hypothetical protein
VISVSELLRRLDERHDRLVIGDGWVPVVDVETRGRFETQGPGGDRQVTQAHRGLERPARPDPDQGGSLGDRQDLSHGDLDVVGADPGRDDRHALTSVKPGRRGEFPISTLELDGVEARGDP